MKNVLLSLIAKYLKGSANPEEKEILDQHYDQLVSDKFQLKDISEEEQADIEARMFTQIQQGMQQSRIKKIKPNYFQWAAILLLPLLFGVLYYAQNSQPSDASLLLSKPGAMSANLISSSGKTYSLSSAEDLIKLQAAGLYQALDSAEHAAVFHEINTPKGAFYQLILPDSSKVWLNAASSIRFPSRFESNKREVFLTGEAYFEIKHDEKAPFYVKSTHQTTRVLGTKFNINAYADQPEDEVTLIEGSVEASSTSLQKVLMKPGYKARIGNNIQYQQVDHAGDYAAWRSGDFYFDNYSLEQVLQMLGRWYNLEVDSRSIPSNRINGLIPRNLLLRDVLALIETTSGVQISVVEGKLKVVR